MQESRAFLFAFEMDLLDPSPSGGGLVRGWNEPDKALPHSDFRKCSAQERRVTGLKVGAG